MHNEPLAVTYQLGCAGIDWVALKQTLLADDFDNGRSPEQLRLSCVNSAVNVFALLGGSVIGTVRVLSDGVGNAYMVDVWTLSTYRNRGVARRMIELALEQLPGQHVYLETDDAQEYYARLGFKPQGVGMSLIVGDYLVNASRGATPGDPGQGRGVWRRIAPANTLGPAACEAADRIRPYVRATPLDHSLYFSQRTGADVHLKLENLQYTGSFKLRGAMNKLLTLTSEQCLRGVVAASSGNHGAAVAYGCRALGRKGTVFVPEHEAGGHAPLWDRGTPARRRQPAQRTGGPPLRGRTRPGIPFAL
jgi:GNAT superfamily N-acetyltransferase